MRSTVKDISRIAGLSVSTVSRVLTNNPHVSPEAVEKVQEAAKSIGYIPNSAARSLVNKKRGLVGLIVPEMENPYYTEIIWGVEETASQRGYGTVLSCNMGGNNRSNNSVAKLLELGVDGIIHSGLLRDDSLSKQLFNWKIPSVLMGRILQDVDSSYVVFNDYQSACIGTEHLISLGHKNIIFLFGKDNSYSSVQKLQGYKDTLLKANIAIDDTLIQVGNLNFEGGVDAINDLLKRGVKFSAIMAGNDMMALGAREAILKSGLGIPEDISLVGIDDIFWSSIQGIELTTVNVPKYEMGERCCEILLQRIENPKLPYEHCVLDGKLVERGSCNAIHTSSSLKEFMNS